MHCREPALALLLLAAASGAPADDRHGEPARKVVVELFTSEGCSSCPPADRLLSVLGGGSNVIPLSFHVDYWNHLGWKDPFSDARWSRRQRHYAQVFGTNRSYTPMMIINGVVDVVGSQPDRVRREIDRYQSTHYDARLVVYAAEHGGWIETTIELTPRASLERGLELLILTYEKDLVTRVERGENARRTLRHDYVVRAAKTVSAPRVGVITEKWRLDPTWNEDEIGVAVLLQHPQSLQIFGADAVDLR